MRLSGHRSLLGAAAMIIVGVVLSMMGADYFTHEEADGLTRSRWWWELVLNSQILCAAFIWFTYIDRLKSATGRLWGVRLAQMLAGLAAVLLPVWFALAAASFGWFETRPSKETIDVVYLSCLIAWCLIAAVLWLMECYVRRRWVRPWYARKPFLRYLPLAVSPSILVVLLFAVELSTGGTQHYIFGPFLLYLQGAVPYVVRAIRVEASKGASVA